MVYGATEFEIVCTAFMLNCDIYIYSQGKWLNYSVSQWKEGVEIMPCAVYLDHEQGCHYNVVLSTSDQMVCACMTSNQTRDNAETCDIDVLGHTTCSKQTILDTNSICHGYLMKDNLDIKQCKDTRYNTDLEYRSKVQAKSRAYQEKRYRNDKSFKKSKLLQGKIKYKENHVYKEKKKNLVTRKYQQDKQYKLKKQASSSEKNKADDTFKQQLKNKYRRNRNYREKKKIGFKQRYSANQAQLKQKYKLKLKSPLKSQYKLKLKSQLKSKYKLKLKSQLKSKYKLKLKSKLKSKYKLKLKSQLKSKYKLKLKSQLISKYKLKLKSQLKSKYKLKLKSQLKSKYQLNSFFRNKLKNRNMQKYHSDVNKKQQLKQENKNNYKRKIIQSPEMKQVFAKRKLRRRREKKGQNIGLANIDSFKKKASEGPVYACACCHRLCFANQVQKYQENVYREKSKMVHGNVRKSISNQYLHDCTKKCFKNCVRSELQICITCHRKLLKGVLPAESINNSLQLDDIPKELKVLNKLEQNLVALHIPFMKVASLPQGGQKAIHGPVVCVPSNTNKASSLPRKEDSDLILKVKLKRKLSYKGYYQYQFVNTNNVHSAVEYLRRNNRWYTNVKTTSETMSTCNTTIGCTTSQCCTENQAEEQSESLQEVKPKESGYTKDQHDLNQINDKKGNVDEKNVEDYGVQYDTCLQPADIGQEVLDHYFDEIYNLAPAEGMNPVKILQEKGNEAKSFPVLFPSGKNTFDESRHLQLTLSRYFNTRLMNADNRFAEDTNYIFYCQYLSELKQVIDKTQISLRKSNKTCNGTNEMNSTNAVRTSSELKKMIQKDEALRFLQPIRGTPSYWQGAQKDLFAMLRQLGIPTWFCSFSAAEFRWKDIINTILRQQGDSRDAENLDWTEKSEVLKTNPVTVARMFDHRFHTFLREVILSNANPIGTVKDYFYRVEFQQRGSPHMHCLFWVKDAPKIDVHGHDAVCLFIDQYVTCALPSESEDSELHNIVKNVQQHSKKHSKSCKKKGTVCRFNFPRPPSQRTFISTNEDDKKEGGKDVTARQMEGNGQNYSTATETGGDDKLTVTEEAITNSENEKAIKKQEALQLLSKVWKAVENLDEPLSCKELFDKLVVDNGKYEEAHKLLATRQSVILKRNPSEVWVNQYNSHLLRCWDANMDIQFVLDPFSCIVYIISNISKAEKEMGMLLRQTKIEAEEGNLNARQTMKAIGSAYLHHREVGVQEAVYRACGLHMKECSRKVTFIPVGENPTRMTKPLSQIKRKSKKQDVDQDTDDDDDIWMTNIEERYQCRPVLPEFEKLCLADFCSDFRVLYKSQIPKGKSIEKVYQLRHDKGFVQKRTRTDPAIIRYPRFNVLRQPEEYYQSVLQFFLPYWTLNQLKPPGFDLYQSFYETGKVRFKGDKKLYKVKEVVEKNRCRYVEHEKAIQEAEDYYDTHDIQEDAWAKLCPETEMNRHESKDKRKPSPHEDLYEEIVDLEKNNENILDISFHITKSETSREEILPVLRSLNKEQKELSITLEIGAYKKHKDVNLTHFTYL